AETSAPVAWLATSGTSRKSSSMPSCKRSQTFSRVAGLSRISTAMTLPQRMTATPFAGDGYGNCFFNCSTFSRCDSSAAPKSPVGDETPSARCFCLISIQTLDCPPPDSDPSLITRRSDGGQCEPDLNCPHVPPHLPTSMHETGI